MRHIGGLILIIFSLFLVYGCMEDHIQPVSSTNEIDKISSDKEIENELLALSEEKEIYTLLKESDFRGISERVNPDEGVTFAFYADFGNPNGYGGQYVTLSKKEIIETNDTKYLWGNDESGKEYKSSLNEYVQQMLLQRWGIEEVDYNIITFNEPAENFAGVINTIHQYYPDAKYVEYHSQGKDEHSFQSLRFIYQESDGKWYLIGIARDVATV